MTPQLRLARRIAWVLLGVLVIYAMTMTVRWVWPGASPSLFRDIRRGMTMAEVRATLGSPLGTSGRVLSRLTTRAVWEYLDVTGTHYLVFQNGELIGWDLPRPFADDPY